MLPAIFLGKYTPLIGLDSPEVSRGPGLGMLLLLHPLHVAGLC